MNSSARLMLRKQNEEFRRIGLYYSGTIVPKLHLKIIELKKENEFLKERLKRLGRRNPQLHLKGRMGIS